MNYFMTSAKQYLNKLGLHVFDNYIVSNLFVQLWSLQKLSFELSITIKY